MRDLKPCPFCGEHLVNRQYKELRDGRIQDTEDWVHPSNWCLLATARLYEYHISKWNERAKMINYEQLVDDLKYEADKLPMKFSTNDELFEVMTEARQAISMLAGLNPEPDLEMKNCPFCGKSAQYIEEDRAGFHIVCTNCDAMTGAFPSAARAIRAWNRRCCREDFCPVQE